MTKATKKFAKCVSPEFNFLYKCNTILMLIIKTVESYV